MLAICTNRNIRLPLDKRREYFKTVRHGAHSMKIVSWS